MTHKRSSAWMILIVVLVSSDFWADQTPSSREEDRRIIERITQDITAWALTKDFIRLKGTIKSWEEFTKLFDFWEDLCFKAIHYELRDLRVRLSRCGDVAWCSALLDEGLEWDGKLFVLKDTRWPAVMEKRDSRWLIVQMHYSFAEDKVLEKAGLRKGLWLGQPEPGLEAVLFAPRFVSSEAVELNSVFSPDGREFFFCRIEPTGPVIYRSIQENGFWTVPESFIPGGIDITLSPDGKHLYYCSRYLHPGSQVVKPDYDFWVREHLSREWGPARPLAAELNSEIDEFYPMATHSGTLYFCRRRQKGDNTLYRSEYRNGAYSPPEKLSAMVNSGHKDSDPYISPNETILIFNSNRPGGYGGDDLYISFRNPRGQWSVAQNLGPSVNTSADEFCAMLTPGGKQLMFTRDVSSDKNQPNWDIFWIDAGFLKALQDKKVTEPAT